MDEDIEKRMNLLVKGPAISIFRLWLNGSFDVHTQIALPYGEIQAFTLYIIFRHILNGAVN